MPVIGRLDGQVDELIISPIGRRRREEETPPARPDAEAPPDPPAPAPSQKPHADESSARADELPVWLL